MKTRTQKTKARAAAMHSGEGGGKIKRINWAFRRLRHQAIKFLANGDAVLRRDLNDALSGPKNFTEMEREILQFLGPQDGPTIWRSFLDHFFGHRINRHGP